MPTQLLTYAELATLWQISPDAARKKVEGLRLPRQPGNDGKTRVLIDLDEVSHQPLRRRSKPEKDEPETDALREHITTLQAEIGRLTDLAASHRADFEHERVRADRALADLSALAARLAAAEDDRAVQHVEAAKSQAAAEQARAEADKARTDAEAIRAKLGAWRAQPWWRRALG